MNSIMICIIVVIPFIIVLLSLICRSVVKNVSWLARHHVPKKKQERMPKKTNSMPQSDEYNFGGKHSKFKNAKIPLHVCFKLALKNMWKKKFRFIIMIIICSISLAFLSFTIELNGDKIRQNVYTMVANNYNYTDIKEYLPLDKQSEKENIYNKYNSVSLSNNAYTDIKDKIPNLNIFKYEEVKIKYAGKNINITVKPGETLAILGATGSGKSSLVNLVPRFYDVTDGKILVDGENIKDLTIRSLRSNIGIVFQKTELFTGTIEENVKWGNLNATHEDVVKACKIAQAHDFISGFSEGYNTIIGEKGSSLSGGQKQRIAIARAILRNPSILIFDDATSALDLKTEAALYKALRENMKDTTILLVAQRIASAKGASKILVLDNGMEAAVGTNDELLASSSIYQDIYNSQLRQEEDETNE